MKKKYPPLEPDRYYHIYNRGNNGENLFVEDKNYSFFLKKYAMYCFPVFDTFAYCLLKNHFHLFVRVRNYAEVTEMIETKNIEEDAIKRLSNKEWTHHLISEQLGHTFNSYAQAFNKMYGRTGSLFERPFERIKVNDDSYFCNIICYIHKNPQKHGFVKDFRSYPYSSYNAYSSNKKTKLNTEQIIDWFGSLENFRTLHEENTTLDKYRIE